MPVLVRGYSLSELARRAGSVWSVWSDSAVLHVVTTTPQVSQTGTPWH
ncbi:MAG TPA: hypothetical protein VGG83_02200 [Trebonia sp.]|jgi:hypothetical protein